MRVFAFALLAVYTVSAAIIPDGSGPVSTATAVEPADENSPSGPCVPGKVFKHKCNTCRCANDGLSAICTIMACPEIAGNRDGGAENPEEIPDRLHRQTRQVSHHHVQLPNDIRPDGDTYEQQIMTYNKPCKPGKFRVYCNECTCKSDGFSVSCTRNVCPKGVYNPDGTLRLPGQVMDDTYLGHWNQEMPSGPCNPPASFFKHYCNMCLCGDDGRVVSCTFNNCPPGMFNKIGHLQTSLEPQNVRKTRQVSHNRPCEAGKQFKIFCNDCACGSDGFSVSCTRMACPPGVYNEDGSLTNAGQVSNDAPQRQTRQVSHNRPCEAGKQFKIFCNDCACGSDGFSVSCTRMACPPGVYNEDGSLTNAGQVSNDAPHRQTRQVSHDRPCEAGKRFKIFCNDCACGSDGFSVLCTRMACPPGVYNEDGSLKNPIQVPDSPSDMPTGPCEPGKSFKHYCNQCLCGADGVPTACTLMLCPDGVYNRDGSLKSPAEVPDNSLSRQTRQVSHNRPCEAGKQFKIFCNDCACGSDGFSVSCTRMACPPGVYNEDGSLTNAGQVANDAPHRQTRQVSHNRPCEAGKQFKIFCNDCACGSDGFSVSCTRMACPPGVYNEDGSLTNAGQVSNDAPHRQTRQVSHDRPCEAGKRFKIFCNDCACGSDGFSVSCTRMACPPGVYNEDGSLKNPIQVPDSPSDMPTGPCEPGKSFKHYCNQCLCGADGVPTACTLMLCPDGVYNRDGSLKSPAEVPNNSLSRQTRQVSHNRPCEAGKQFKIFCNDCACGSDGFSVSCTRMACPPGVYNEDGSLTNAGQVSNDAPHRQTRQVSHNRPCEAGKQFKIFCNDCACGSDGFSVSCTRMACPPGVYNEDGSLTNPAPVPNDTAAAQYEESVPDVPCEPGKSFKFYCNSCRCAADGASSVCTLMLCPKGIWNKDGSFLKSS